MEDHLKAHPERGKSAVSPEAYSGVLDRVFRSIFEENVMIAGQRSAAPGLLAELSGLSVSQQQLLIRNSSRYQAWGLAEELLVQARRGWTEDPRHSEALAHLALEVADQLNATGLREPLLNDLKAEAWSYIGNCLRIQSDLHKAQEAFRTAELLLREGSGDRVERARLLDLQASLLGDFRRFQAAVEVLTEAIGVYRAANDKHLEGRALMKKAKLLRDSGRVDETIPLLTRAARLVDVGREPWLAFALKKNLVIHLLEAGRPEEAQRFVPEVRQLAREHAGRLERLRLLWTEGLLCKSLGQNELAVEVLKQAREGFVAAGIGYDVALISLDLAAFYLDSGRTDAVRKLAAESVPLFASRGVHRELMMAWTLFREAAERDAVTLGLVKQVASRIRLAQPRPNETAETP
jgi:tetratricopeptide (TPR) repeat protein